MLYIIIYVSQYTFTHVYNICITMKSRYARPSTSDSPKVLYGQMSLRACGLRHFQVEITQC